MFLKLILWKSWWQLNVTYVFEFDKIIFDYRKFNKIIIGSERISEELKKIIDIKLIRNNYMSYFDKLNLKK